MLWKQIQRFTQWRAQNFRKGGTRRVARNLEREIKPDEKNEDQKKSFYSDSARSSAKIQVKTKNKNKKRSSLRFSPFFCPDFLPKFQRGRAWLSFAYYSEVFIHYWGPKGGGIAQCPPKYDPRFTPGKRELN